MSTAKKFVIKPVRNNNKMDAVHAQEVWLQLQSAIKEIYSKNASNLSFEELYRKHYNLCLNKHTDLLYNGIQDMIKAKATLKLEELLQGADENLLSCILDTWTDHKIVMNMIKDILMYMDKTSKRTPVYELSLQIFNKIIVSHKPLGDRLVKLLLLNIEKERQGCIIDRSLVQGVLSMLVDLGQQLQIYEEIFEKPFLESTRLFYVQESQRYLLENQCSEYLIKAEHRIQDETNRLSHYLYFSTNKKLLDIVYNELLTVHAKVLIEMRASGSMFMFQENKVVDIRRMHGLFSLVPSLVDLLRDAMCNYIKISGLAIVSNQDNSKDPFTFVQEIFDLKTKMIYIITEGFKDEKKAHKMLKLAFESFINVSTKCASHLSTYIDDLLKEGTKGLIEQEIEAKLDQSIFILKFIADKDIFENFYKAQLAKRLLNGRTIHEDLEKSMISKLKAECGQQFTCKMEGMFLDMKLSKEIFDLFKCTDLCKSNPLDIEVQTLTASHWALKVPTPCVLPTIINECMNQFNAFYIDKFNASRRLSWLTNMGSADMKATFATGKKELKVSTYQMCILLLFNHSNTISLDTIRQSLQVPEVELRRHLLSLCTPKLKILIKESKGKLIEDNDNFTFNNDFISNNKKIKIPLISAKEIRGEEETTQMEQKIEEDRRHQVEAAIVRVMKARKRVAHNDLVAEVSRQLLFRFSPNLQFIKKRIESLIEREYIAREDEKNYKYLA